MQFKNGYVNGIKYIECPICSLRFFGNSTFPGLRSFAQHIKEVHNDNQVLMKFSEAQLSRNKAKKHTYMTKIDKYNQDMNNLQ